jgi:hypothetical protein
MLIPEKPFEPGDDESQGWIVDGQGHRLSRKELNDFFAKVRRSRKFREWRASEGTGVFERHFSPQQLANDWGVDAETIRNLFRNEPGVVKLGDRNPKHKRAYLTLRIPESVAQRIHKRISA